MPGAEILGSSKVRRARGRGRFPRTVVALVPGTAVGRLPTPRAPGWRKCRPRGASLGYSRNSRAFTASGWTLWLFSENALVEFEKLC
jgi:hypothetical protein